MESGINKIKVVWICHFSNTLVRKKLKINSNQIDFAPWITATIEEIEKRQDVELHVISPHASLTRDKAFIINDVNYYFIKTGIPFTNHNWPKYFKYDYITRYKWYSKKINKIVRSINPDIINLQGAENPYYSASILLLKDFPVLINVQGIFNCVSGGKFITGYDQYRAELENRIYREFTHFGIRAEFMREYISNINPEAKFYKQHYAIKKIKTNNTGEIKKEYDLVYFARLVTEKGIEDLIHAIKIIKEYKNDILLYIIGNGSKGYLDHLRNLIIKLGLDGNIIFKGALSTIAEVYNEAQRAKISVLPTHSDTIPGTIIESMFLGLPVVSYPVGGIPSLNKDEEIIILAEKQNIKDLAMKITELLDNKSLQNEIAAKGKYYASKYFDNTKAIDDLINYYRQII